MAADKPRSENRKLKGLVAARLSPEELEQVKAAADAQGVSVSQLVRERVLAAS